MQKQKRKSLPVFLYAHAYVITADFIDKNMYILVFKKKKKNIFTTKESLLYGNLFLIFST